MKERETNSVETLSINTIALCPYNQLNRLSQLTIRTSKCLCQSNSSTLEKYTVLLETQATRVSQSSHL